MTASLTCSLQVQRQATNRLREHFSQPIMGEPITRMQSNASAYSMPSQAGLSRRSTATTLDDPFTEEMEMKIQ